MSVVTKINLLAPDNSIPPAFAKKMSALSAEWWEEGSRFVLIRLRKSGCDEEFQLRLDLDKQVFIDRTSKADLNSLLEKNAYAIWRAVLKHKH